VPTNRPVHQTWPLSSTTETDTTSVASAVMVEALVPSSGRG
jgi:hypothetical protein